MPSATQPSASTAVLFREATAPYDGDVIEGEMVPDAQDVAEIYSGTVDRLEHALEFVNERLADAELAMEDRGWERISFSAKEAFTRAGQRTAAARSREMVVLNPLVRRGVALRIGYIWGNGVQITARADGSNGAGEQDVNAVVQEFLDDDSNREAFSGEQAREESERALATDGNQPWVLFTSPRTGRVQIRALPFEEIEERINNPEDRSEPWFYLRKWTERQPDPFTGAAKMVERKAMHPALFYRPRTRPRSYAGVEVRWDAPVYVCSVNRLQGWDFGVGDVYTALPWARAYAVFLTDWAQLIKALSKFAYTKKSDRPRTASQRTAQALTAGARRGATGQAPTGSAATPTSDSGAMVELGPGTSLEAVPKTGATIDSESGKPLAAMVAAGLDLPVTWLLGDPGISGARATAETLDEPTKLSMNARRNRRAEEHRAILRYVILEAVRAPGGPLRGRIFRDDFDREQVVLAGPGDGTDQTIDITWPPLDKADPAQRIAAIVAADGTDHLPGELVTRLLLQALEVDDVDAVMAEMVDEHGNFLDPALAAQVSAGIAAARAFRNGEDPVGAATGRPSTAAQQSQQQGADTSRAASGSRSGETSDRAAREAAGIPPRPRMTRRVVERDTDGNITALVDVELPQPDDDA